MPTSGSKDFSITRGKIIGAALRKIGAYDQGEAIPGEEDEDATFALNLLVKEWSAHGLDIWLRTEITLFLQKNQQSYQIGTAFSDRATSGVVTETTLSVGVAAGATVISVTDSTGMLDGDHVGFRMDDGFTHWTTWVSVAGGTIATGPASPASTGSRVYNYTDDAERPQELRYINRRDVNGIDTPIELIGDNEYRSLTLKSTSGPPNQAFYKPTLDSGTLYLWPTDGGTTWDKVIMQSIELADDMDSTADEPEFPIEWGNALIFQLAHDLAPEYGVNETKQARLYRVAEKKLNDLLDYSQENASVTLSLDQQAGQQ